MVTGPNVETDYLKEFEGLTGYIEILMTAFPKPITRKELAREAGVSQPAITKIKDRLLKICDQNALIFNRKLILKTDETFWKLLVLYFLQMKPTKILLSNYGWEMIKRLQIHSRISKEFKEYSSYFDEKDTETIIRIALHNLENLQVANQIKTSIGDPEQRVMLLSMQYVKSLESILQKLDLPMTNIEDLLEVLMIRDKLFCLIKQLLWLQIQKASILQGLPENEKTTYLQVYSGTLDFYLRKLFEIGTCLIKQNAERRKLEFKEDYERIGHFYKPLQT